MAKPRPKSTKTITVHLKTKEKKKRLKKLLLKRKKNYRDVANVNVMANPKGSWQQRCKKYPGQ